MMTALTGFGLTVIAEVPPFPSLVAVIVAVPGAIAVTSPVDDTLATLGALVDHDTARPASGCLPASLGSAFSCVVWPTTRSLVFGVTATDATGTDGDRDRRHRGLPLARGGDDRAARRQRGHETAGAHGGDRRVARRERDRTTGERVRLARPAAAATSCTVCPTSRSRLVGDSLTLATGVGLTVTSATALLPSALAAICTVPTATPVTTPLPETVAIAGSPLAQTTLCPWSALPDASSTSAVSGTLAPTATVAVFGVMTTEATEPPSGSRESLLHEVAAMTSIASHHVFSCGHRIPCTKVQESNQKK